MDSKTQPDEAAPASTSDEAKRESTGAEKVIHHRAQENYIKAIFQLSAQGWQGKRSKGQDSKNQHSGYINPHDLSKRLAVNVSAVYLMFKKLERKELATYQPYKGIRLTAKGERLALTLLRRHRLWESFLQSKLGFDWSEVHPLAEELEHIDNEELIERLEKFLNFPTEDPHGDPIPSRDGTIDDRFHSDVKISELAVGERATLTRVLESSHDFLRYLKSVNLTLGTTLVLDSKSQFDSSYMIAVKDKPVYLSTKAANSLLVRKSP